MKRKRKKKKKKKKNVPAFLQYFPRTKQNKTKPYNQGFYKPLVLMSRDHPVIVHGQKLSDAA